MRGARYPKYKPTGIPWLPEVPEANDGLLKEILG